MKGLQFTNTTKGKRRPVKNQTNNKGIYYSDVKVRVKPDYTRNTMSVNNLPVNPDTVNKNIGKHKEDWTGDPRCRCNKCEGGNRAYGENSPHTMNMNQMAHHEKGAQWPNSAQGEEWTKLGIT
mgnify:CR=1 FL=1